MTAPRIVRGLYSMKAFGQSKGNYRKNNKWHTEFIALQISLTFKYR